MLSCLDALLGVWEMGVSFEAGYFGPGSRPVAGRGGRARFTWLDGEFFLIQRLAAGNPAAPSGIVIIGPGETAETFCQHYDDSRGAARICQMSLNDGVWKLRREAPASGGAASGCSLAAARSRAPGRAERKGRSGSTTLT